jgi:hypothetical protein
VIDNCEIKSLKACFSIVDGETLIKESALDTNTDFTGVGLDSARIDPGLKEALKDNIREKRWKEWLCKGLWWQRLLKNLSVRIFWMITNFGKSTKSLICWFFGFALAFAVIYFILELCNNGVIFNLRVVCHPWYYTAIRAFYFSIVTMTTLGFGDMYAVVNGVVGHLLIILQVILGYILLGALITRFGILFVGTGPSDKAEKPASNMNL